MQIVHEHMRVVVVSLLLFGLALLPGPAGAQWVTMTYEDAGFEATFPGVPEPYSVMQTNLSEPYLYQQYTAQSVDGVMLAVAYSNYPASYAIDAAAELKANQDNFNEGMEARLVTSRQTEYERAPGDKLPALEFISESDVNNLTSKGLVIVDGQSAYMVVAIYPRGVDAGADTDRLIRSFRLLPR